VNRGQRGNVSVLVTAVIVVAVLLATAVARLGSAVAEKQRANNAADATALAAAGALAAGNSPASACMTARRTAVDNGARLLTCQWDDAAAVVTVAMGEARAIARAVVDAAGVASRGNSAHTVHRGDFRHFRLVRHMFFSRGSKGGPISAPMPGTEAER
jgi:secretion/DNA translocation related TadE-like protein